MNPIAKKFARIALPLVVLAVAGAIAASLVMTRAKPERAKPAEQRVLVEAQPVHRQAHQLKVRAAGTVEAARSVVVQPQVAGRIVWINDQLIPGGLVHKGDVLFKIDDRDYKLALEEQKNQLAQARAQLAQERGRVKVAKREWELFKDEAKKDLGSEADPSLALRKPQLESAKVAVDAAQAAIDRAQLNLQRTTVRAPFDAMVVSESADRGQLVSTQSQVATLVGTAAFWVQVSVPVDKLPYVNIPGVNATQGAKASVEQDIGPRHIERQAHVVRLLGDLDQTGRMARVLAEIDDPLQLAGDGDPNAGHKAGIPLLLNSYVDVEIAGPTSDKLIEVPREAVHEGDKVYAYADGKLDIRQVHIAWRRPKSVLVDKGLADGDQIITSPVATPLQGMKLRLAGESDTPKTISKKTSPADAKTGAKAKESAHE